VESVEKRRASSPVLAEMFLISIAIMVAVPLGGFAFGLIGSHASTAAIAVSASECSAAGPSTTSCIFSLINRGTQNAQFQPYSISIIFHGNKITEDSPTACQGEGGGNVIAPGSSLRVDCTFGFVPGNAGDEYTGWFSITSIGWIPFAGRF